MGPCLGYGKQVSGEFEVSLGNRELCGRDSCDKTVRLCMDILLPARLQKLVGEFS